MVAGSTKGGKAMIAQEMDAVWAVGTELDPGTASRGSNLLAAIRFLGVGASAHRLAHMQTGKHLFSLYMSAVASSQSLAYFPFYQSIIKP